MGSLWEEILCCFSKGKGLKMGAMERGENLGWGGVYVKGGARVWGAVEGKGSGGMGFSIELVLGGGLGFWEMRVGVGEIICRLKDDKFINSGGMRQYFWGRNLNFFGDKLEVSAL